jgi:hypothetical protein
MYKLFWKKLLLKDMHLNKIFKYILFLKVSI